MKLLLILACCPALWAQTPRELLNGGKPILDAHNCYPYEGRWADRIDRALRTGSPVGIEQDLAWSINPATGLGQVVVSHTAKTIGQEPTLKDYFFEHVRPMVERALRENDRSRWPLIVVHFDVKDNRAELHHAVWNMLGAYESWITTALKTADDHELARLDVKPLLVLTEDNDSQEEVFFKQVPLGSKLRLFGSAHTGTIPGASDRERAHAAATLPPEALLAERPTNYRRWWNSSWQVVEEGGQRAAGKWTARDEARLHALVDRAHKLGFWIRFYTLDGFVARDNRGWDEGYNFGSLEAVAARWRAAISAGVDLIATDQYEDFAGLIRLAR
jgi:hypothetical protein